MNLTVLTPPRWKSLNGIRVIECCVCVRYSEFKNKCHLKMLILTANYFCCLSSDFRERKTKRTLHRWCLHNWKHTFFNPILAHHISNSRSNSLLSCTPSKRIQSLHILCISIIRMHDVSREPNDDRSKFSPRLSNGYHNGCWNPRRNDVKRRVLSLAQRPSKAILEVPNVLYCVSQVREPRVL